MYTRDVLINTDVHLYYIENNMSKNVVYNYYTIFATKIGKSIFDTIE